MIQGKIDGILMDISRLFPVLVGDTSACEEKQLLTCEWYSLSVMPVHRWLIKTGWCIDAVIVCLNF